MTDYQLVGRPLGRPASVAEIKVQDADDGVGLMEGVTLDLTQDEEDELVAARIIVTYSQ